MIDTADILLKAAEDVQSGMWCKGAMFQWPNDSQSSTTYFVDQIEPSLHLVTKMKRCAIGSLALATAQLGGTQADYEAACQRAANWIDLPAKDLEILAAHGTPGPDAIIVQFNDAALPDDPFEAGQQLGELFRKAAESL